jgi:uncharacterized protein
MTASNKTAVVTGASSGIGAVYAYRLAARGYDLILVARRADRLSALSEKLSASYGVKVQTLVADLANEADLAKVEDVLGNDASVRLLVNNAGLARLAPLAQASVSDSTAQLALNITALTRLTHAVLPGFLARNEGDIINVASVLSVSRGLQAELADTGVRLQIVLPATTATEIWDVAGVPLSTLNQDSVMSAENMVDAALIGFDRGEKLTWPSVADEGLWEKYDVARAALFAATQTGKPAPRYQAA